MALPTFKVGTGINVINDCDAEITGETDEFVDDGSGVRVYALYRHGACVELSSGSFRWYYKSGVDWIELAGCRHDFPSYWGYVYAYCNIDDGARWDFKVVCTIGDVTMTEYFSIVSDVSYCDQLVRVEDKDTGADIANVKVRASKPGEYVECTTGSNGECTLYNLEEDFVYTAIGIYPASIPANYECEYSTDCVKDDWAACTTKETFKLKEKEECTCTSWVDRECVDDTHRRQTRTCTPSDCDIEERVIYDPSCTPKKDTKIRCYDKEADINTEVTLEAKLEEAGFPYNDIENGYVKFYMNNAYQGADYTDSNGKAYLNITPTAPGTYTIKTVFEAAGDYNGCEATCTLTVNPKEDTKIKCYDKETDVNVKVTLEAKLEEATFPYNDIENGYVKFYTPDSFIGGDYTDANGKAYMDYTPPSGGTFAITVVFSATDCYNGSLNTCTLIVTEPIKKETRLGCYDAETTEGSEATLEAKLEYKNWAWHDLEGKQVNFKIDTVDAIFGTITDADGVASVAFPAELVPSAGTYAFTATFVEDGDYDGSTCEGTLTVTSLPTLLLVPTKTTLTIDEDLCPEVECESGIDDVCIYVDGVKTDNCADSGIVANIKCKPIYPNDFDKMTGAYLGGVGVHALQAKSPNASDSNIVDITVTEEAEPHGKIVSMSPECTDDTPCFKEEGDEVEFNVTIKNDGGEKGEFRMYLIDDTTDDIIDIEPCLPLAETELECWWKDLSAGEEFSDTLDSNWKIGAMPDYDWKLRIEVRKQTTPDVVDDEYKFTVHLGGAGGHVLILDEIPSPLIIGEEHTFTGELTKDAVAVPDAPVRIMEKDLIWGDFIAEGTTNANGEFSISWIVEDVEVGKAEIYAHHPASDTKSGIQKVEIKKEWEVKKIVAYGAAAVGMYTGGSIIETVSPKLKAAGTGLRIGTIIPAALCGLETYKLIKEKLPFI